MDNSLIWVESIVGAFVFLRQVLALMAGHVTINEYGHDDQQQQDQQQ